MGIEYTMAQARRPDHAPLAVTSSNSECMAMHIQQIKAMSSASDYGGRMNGSLGCSLHMIHL